MDNTVGDTLHCEDQLKTTLQYDDKEKVLHFWSVLFIYLFFINCYNQP